MSPRVVASLPLSRKPDLVLKPLGAKGDYVAKDLHRGTFFRLGPQEHFLLLEVDQGRSRSQIRDNFASQFDDELSDEDLDDFLQLAIGRGLIVNSSASASESEPSQRKSGTSFAQPRGSLLYFRFRVFDPDQLFGWVEPKIRFLWTQPFVILSAICILAAIVILWAERLAVVSAVASSLRWDTVVVAWCTMILLGLLHECAHGLTCKHYGGEVREIGFLSMYFMPCFYCNVSDAWLFTDKRQRLLVTLSGGYFELFVWALAVLVWRITMPDTLINYIVFVVVTLSGISSLFNFNPLIKLDGYYLLSDFTETPNLRQKSLERLMSYVRWILWGGPQPESAPKGRFLITYGLLSWCFTLFFLSIMLMSVYSCLNGLMGPLCVIPLLLLAGMSYRGVVTGLFGEELKTMILRRHLRKLGWILVLVSLAAIANYTPFSHTATGDFEIVAGSRAELRAPIDGFLQEVYYEEGDQLSSGTLVAQLGIPELESLVIQKQARLREAEAQLALARAGASSEEIEAKRQQVKSAMTWSDVANHNLKRQREVLKHDLLRLDKLIERYQSECRYASKTQKRLKDLRSSKSVTEAEYEQAVKEHEVCSAQLAQTAAERESRVARGVMNARLLLAEREKELADQEAGLAILLAGNRSEEVAATEATVERIREELRDYESRKERLKIVAPVRGTLSTRRLREKVGDFFPAGELICEIEDNDTLEAVIALTEDQAAWMEPGQHVRLKARSLSNEVLEAKVIRVAPRAEEGEAQNTVNVYCELDGNHETLRSGMTGYARVLVGESTLAGVTFDKIHRTLRTEFWW